MKRITILNQHAALHGELQKMFGNDLANEIANEGNDGDDLDLPSLGGSFHSSRRPPKSFNPYGKQQTARSEMNFYSIYNEKNSQKQSTMKRFEDLAKQQSAEDDDGIDLSKPITKPYGNGCYNKMRFFWETFLVMHARIYAIYLLTYQIGTRGLVIFDMYTDIKVAWALYKGNEKAWFMLSCLFIALPFVLVWSASLRFIQAYLEKLFYKIYNKWAFKMLINIMLIAYMFPPVGSLVIAAYEVIWLGSDIYYGFKAFMFGTGLVEANDRQTKAMKTYRKAIEIFAESLVFDYLCVWFYTDSYLFFLFCSSLQNGCELFCGVVTYKRYSTDAVAIVYFLAIDI